jgi:hypothetical protein
MRITKLRNVELVRYWRVAFKTLVKYQSRRAFERLALIVQALDERGI